MPLLPTIYSNMENPFVSILRKIAVIFVQTSQSFGGFSFPFCVFNIIFFAMFNGSPLKMLHFLVTSKMSNSKKIAVDIPFFRCYNKIKSSGSLTRGGSFHFPLSSVASFFIEYVVFFLMFSTTYSDLLVEPRRLHLSAEVLFISLCIIV